MPPCRELCRDWKWPWDLLPSGPGHRFGDWVEPSFSLNYNKRSQRPVCSQSKKVIFITAFQFRVPGGEGVDRHQCASRSKGLSTPQLLWMGFGPGVGLQVDRYHSVIILLRTITHYRAAQVWFESRLAVDLSKQRVTLPMFGLGSASIQASNEWRPDGVEHGLEPGRR